MSFKAEHGETIVLRSRYHIFPQMIWTEARFLFFLLGEWNSRSNLWKWKHHWKGNQSTWDIVRYILRVLLWNQWDLKFLSTTDIDQLLLSSYMNKTAKFFWKFTGLYQTSLSNTGEKTYLSNNFLTDCYGRNLFKKLWLLKARFSITTSVYFFNPF